MQTVAEADLVFFAGGEDVSPKVYGQPSHPTTYCSPQRDAEEMAIYKEAKELNKKMLGICRGSQFLCAMQPGGMLVQDQPNRLAYHPMLTNKGETIRVSSTHHQAQYPFNMKKEDYNVIGWTENLHDFHKDGNNKELGPKQECEIVHYPKANALGIQSHPEYMDYDHESNLWMRKLLNDFMNGSL